MTKIDEICQWIRQRSSGPGLDPGAPIPSIHKLIPQFKASKATVEKALNKLVAEGVIRAEHGRGYFPIPPWVRAGTIDLALGASQGILDSGSFFWRIFSGIAAAAAGIGRDIRIFSSLVHGGDEKKERFFESIRATRNIFGVLTLDMHSDDIFIGLRDMKVPTVAVDHDASTLGIDSVVVDSGKDASTLTEMLIDKGHRRIACVETGLRDPDGSFVDPDHQARIDGYKEALASRGIEFLPELLFTRPETPGEPIESAVMEAHRRHRFTAALLEYSEIRHLKKLMVSAKRKPELAMMGDRNFEIPSFVGRRIFAAYDFEDMGRLAVKTLLAGVQTGPHRARRETISPVIT